MVLEMYSNDKDTDKVALLKNEAFRYKGIKLAPLKFGQDNTKFTSNKEKNEIYQSLLSVKAINENTANVLKQLSSNKYDNFYDLYIEMKNNGLSKTHIENLCKIGYFQDFCSKRTSLWLTQHYGVSQKKGQPKVLDINKKILKKDDIMFVYKSLGTNMSMMEFYEKLKQVAIKETAKQFSFEEGVLASFLYQFIDIQDNDKLEEYAWELSLLGTTVDEIDADVLMGRIIKYNPSTNRILMKHCKTGVESWYRLNCDIHVKEKDYIFISSISEKMFRGKKNIIIEKMINLSETY